ncbi:hypothetical protein SDD30_15340 [Moorella naiadis]|uniref:hypothetical protein n=1 Tax=Moorella naiadis (nom. illeg.) TaxID=3093670 RepID=UPI003D9C82C4
MPGRKDIILVAVTVFMLITTAVFTAQPVKAAPVSTVAFLEGAAGAQDAGATQAAPSGSVSQSVQNSTVSQPVQNAANSVSQAIDNAGGVKPVTPVEFAGKVNKFIAGLNAAIGGLVIPVATFAMLVSICIIILGALVGHSNLKRYGWGGLFLASVGLLLFWGLPVLLGLLQALATRFAG